MSNNRTIPSSQVPDTVTQTIKIDGSPIDSKYQVDSIAVTKAVNRISFAKVVLLDGDLSQEDFEVSNEELFIPGKEIEILVGYHADDVSIFKGIIIKHAIKLRANGNSLLILDCKDKTVKMTIGQRSRYYYESTDSDIIETLINEHGLEASVEATSITFPEVVQYHATNWDFMMSRVDMNGMICLVDAGKVTVQPPAVDAEPALTLAFGATVRELDAEIDARTQLNASKAFTWDYTNQELLEIEGADPGVSLNGNLAFSDLADVVGLDNWELRHGGKVTDAELQAWADARLLRSQLAKVRGRIKFQGYADLNPGMTVELEGMGDRFNGKAFVSGVRHSINGGEWLTDAEFGLDPEWFATSFEISSLPAGGMLPAIRGLQIGLVTALEGDPDGEDRIKVRLPVIDPGEEGVWARIASLDAGENRGAYFRPEIEDEVIVGFINDDPRSPVVLGMLNSSAKPAPITAADDNHEKGFVTRSEMKMIFDDDKVSLTIETPAGKKVSIDEDAGVIQMEDENGNTVTMSSDGITLESGADVIIKASGDVKIEGTNVEAKANASFKAEGTSGAELSSSATAVLKGSLVQIN